MSGAAPTPAAAAPVELSVVMPCLNEADTLEVCLEKAKRGMAEAGVAGEIIVADNGSSDGSQEIARRSGARLVPVATKGYGSALMGGIAAARGTWVIMGDADDSYDFQEIPKFVEKLRLGSDVVQGCRLPAGGGRVLPGAMPFLHRWWGNPMFTRMAQWMFGSPVNDIYCGLRGFRRDWQQSLGQRCLGMEFATEMLIKASLSKARIAEVPITLHPDGRKAHAPHLKTFRDGWRTLRFFLLCSPRWLFLVPGLLLIALGLAGGALALAGATVLGARLDAHTLLVAGLLLLCGYQAVLFAIFTKTFAITEGILPADPRLDRFFRVMNLERGLLVSAAAIALGGGLLIAAVNEWWSVQFGRLDYARTMRLVIPGAICVALGVQTALSSFFVSILGLRRK